MADAELRHLMEGVADLPHPKLKRFATKIRAQLTAMQNPNVPDFCDAVCEAASAIVTEESDEK